MEENVIQQNDITSVEYRRMMEAQLAKDFWFMCDKRPDYLDRHNEAEWAKICFSMEWGNGWLASFYDLCRQLLTEVKSDFQWSQLKEKFGGARCYYDGTITPYGEQLIAEFEKESETICEHCGKSGKLRGTGWYMTLCDKCWEECKN